MSDRLSAALDRLDLATRLIRESQKHVGFPRQEYTDVCGTTMAYVSHVNTVDTRTEGQRLREKAASILKEAEEAEAHDKLKQEIADFLAGAGK